MFTFKFKRRRKALRLKFSSHLDPNQILSQKKTTIRPSLSGGIYRFEGESVNLHQFPPSLTFAYENLISLPQSIVSITTCYLTNPFRQTSGFPPIVCLSSYRLKVIQLCHIYSSYLRKIFQIQNCWPMLILMCICHLKAYCLIALHRGYTNLFFHQQSMRTWFQPLSS